ncbi:hypothetical protein EC988_001186 [Linderina pennispora]|nr:hypothetical protein EC988_001186 [Linderina pennispora]
MSGDLGSPEGGAFARGVGFDSQGNTQAKRTTFFGLKSSEPKMETYEMKENPRRSMGGTGGEGNVEKGNHEHIENVEITRSRKLWVAFTYLTTWWIPSPFLSWCGRMKRPDVRMAWREKVAICVIIVFLWAFLLFIIIGLGLILCPKENVWTMDDVANLNTDKKAYVALYGNVYDLTDWVRQPHGITESKPTTDTLFSFYIGRDINATFPLSARAYCPDLIPDDQAPNNNLIYPIAGASDEPDENAQFMTFKHSFAANTRSDKLKDPLFYENTAVKELKNFKKGGVVWKFDWLNDKMFKKWAKRWRVINKEVFNLQPYFDAIENSGLNVNNMYNFLDTKFEGLVAGTGGYGSADITEQWNKLNWSPETRLANYNCIKKLFYVGTVDDRQSVRCLFTNYMLVAFACLLMLVVLVKFLAALQFGNKKRPMPPSKFVICQVPCYTEDEESIAKTVESLAALEYTDKQKLIFVICDGNIVGHGNDRSTPRIVLDCLGVDPEYDPPGRDYLAIAEGSRRHNIGKVYSGLYEFEGHVVPFMVVAKVGTPDESSRSGNRGKRDSQILLMSFLNKVHFDLPMTPLELEMYHQMRHIIGIPPKNFEYLLQIDADTEVMPDSLTRLVSACSSDQRIAGICGETMLGNESQSWTTMMQVYEYFISHHMAKAFESLFGAVTCLPGCFCMYRLRNSSGKPLLIANPILEAYSELHVDTLHKKNLLSLGEDRYLTTLMMKHFPNFKLKFIQDAKCRTIAPDKWSVLVSQRRRWINSTVHNLAELLFLPDLCGFCCFSMRFVVFLDLFGTLTMPTTLIYFAYLIYVAVTGLADVGYISLILIGAIYGVQAIIFILRREWQHVGWMLIYLCAYPLWSFVLPIYSFWHFDDFSWGNTRVVVGDGKRKIIVNDDKPFDPASIPQRRWMEYESELASAGVLNAPPPNMNPGSREDERQSMYSSQSGPISRIGSAVGFVPAGGTASVHGSSAGSVFMGGNFVDPRLSTAMTNPQMMAMQAQSPYTSVAVPNQGAWVPPNTMSMYSEAQGMRPMSHMSAASGPNSPHVASMYVPQPHEFVPSGRSTPVSYGVPMGQPPMAMLPTDDQIVDAVRRILAGADLTQTTKKRIRMQLNQEFGCDLTPKKDFISSVVDQMLVGGM